MLGVGEHIYTKRNNILDGVEQQPKRRGDNNLDRREQGLHGGEQQTRWWGDRGEQKYCIRGTHFVYRGNKNIISEEHISYIQET
jgi:hypothetical protein